MTIYLDYNASAPMLPQVIDAVTGACRGEAANPSSLHGRGRQARGAVESARRAVAALIDAEASQIVFTSGGTEANQLGVNSHSLERVCVTETAHPSLAAACQQGAAEWHPIPIRTDGSLDTAAAAALFTAVKPTLVALELANHETGVVHDVSHMARLAHDVGARVHCDAVAALGKLEFSAARLGVDSLAISGHKIGAPLGIGAVYSASGMLSPLYQGGHQERERRPGTENWLGIVGMGAAATVASGWPSVLKPRLVALAQRLEAGILAIEGASINGAGTRRTGHTVNARFDGAPGEVIVTALDLEGVCVSTGAACSSGSREPSAVLVAMGQSENEALSAVRFSVGWDTKEDDITHVLGILPQIVDRARQFAS